MTRPPQPRAAGRRRRRPTLAAMVTALALAACPAPPEPEPDPVARGRDLFFNETFDGNGRTCATCHREEDNFGLTPNFIGTLSPDDPLFVAETDPDLAENFENPRLMRDHGLILENLDGFGDLEERFVMRGVPHVLALRTSVAGPDGPRTGWSGDGAPGDGSLRSFATGAVIQHFPRTTARVPGEDFRLPTDEELDALEQFLLSLGRQQDLELPLPLTGTVAGRGQEIFLDNSLGKCNACHFNAGANGDPAVFGPDPGNRNFDTGVEDLPDQPADLTGEQNPPDDGLGTPGDGTFNTPPLVEAADTGPFFHDNSVATLEGAVAFYNGDAFNQSPAGQLLQQATGSGIRLDATQVVAVAAFLRVINALENVRATRALLQEAVEMGPRRGLERLPVAVVEIDDAVSVLTGANLHPPAAVHLREARALTERAYERSSFGPVQDALRALDDARSEMIESPAED